MCVLGYPLDYKGFKLLNLDTKHIFISRHVVFHELVFPFLNQAHTSTPSDPHFLQTWYHSTDADYSGLNILFPVENSSRDFSAHADIAELDKSDSVLSSQVEDYSSPVSDDTSFSTDEWLPPDVDTLVNLHSESSLSDSEPFIRKSTRDRQRP